MSIPILEIHINIWSSYSSYRRSSFLAPLQRTNQFTSPSFPHLPDGLLLCLSGGGLRRPPTAPRRPTSALLGLLTCYSSPMGSLTSELGGRRDSGVARGSGLGRAWLRRGSGRQASRGRRRKTRAQCLGRGERDR
jgi:hypothetical protein